MNTWVDEKCFEGVSGDVGDVFGVLNSEKMACFDQSGESTQNICEVEKSAENSYQPDESVPSTYLIDGVTNLDLYARIATFKDALDVMRSIGGKKPLNVRRIAEMEGVLCSFPQRRHYDMAMQVMTIGVSKVLSQQGRQTFSQAMQDCATYVHEALQILNSPTGSERCLVLYFMSITFSMSIECISSYVRFWGWDIKALRHVVDDSYRLSLLVNATDFRHKSQLTLQENISVLWFATVGCDLVAALKTIRDDKDKSMYEKYVHKRRKSARFNSSVNGAPKSGFRDWKNIQIYNYVCGPYAGGLEDGALEYVIYTPRVSMPFSRNPMSVQAPFYTITEAWGRNVNVAESVVIFGLSTVGVGVDQYHLDNWKEYYLSKLLSGQDIGFREDKTSTDAQVETITKHVSMVISRLFSWVSNARDVALFLANLDPGHFEQVDWGNCNSSFKNLRVPSVAHNDYMELRKPVMINSQKSDQLKGSAQSRSQQNGDTRLFDFHLSIALLVPRATIDLDNCLRFSTDVPIRTEQHVHTLLNKLPNVRVLNLLVYSDRRRNTAFNFDLETFTLQLSFHPFLEKVVILSSDPTKMFADGVNIHIAPECMYNRREANGNMENWRAWWHVKFCHDRVILTRPHVHGVRCCYMTVDREMYGATRVITDIFSRMTAHQVGTDDLCPYMSLLDTTRNSTHVVNSSTKKSK